VTTPGGPPDTDEPWFVPVLALDDIQHGDGSEDDADDPEVSEVAPGTTLAWSSWAGEEQVPRRLAAAAGALALRLTEALPELSHQNPGGGERFEHAQLIAVLANALGVVVELADDRQLAGDDLARLLGATHDGAVIAAIVAEATDESAVTQQSAWLRRTGEEVHRAMWRRFHPVGDSRFRVRLRRGERALLRRVLAEQHQRLSEDGPSLAPLYPPGYGDGDDASAARSAEFSSLTKVDLTATRSSALERVQASLEDREIDAETLAVWMRTLNDVRLVMAAELDITDDEQAPPAPWSATFPAWRTYAVLGNLVHEAVLALRTQL
jgi:hypothetical protein